MKAPIGAEVGIFYDSPREINNGDCLQTISGRVYLIISVRIQKKGIHIGRKHIRAIVLENPPEGSVVYPIYWYKR